MAEGASLLNMQGVLQQPFTWALQVRPGESSGTRACIDTLSRVLSILASVPTRHGCCASGNFHRNCDQEDDDTDELMDVWSSARAYCGATWTLSGSGGEEVLIWWQSACERGWYCKTTGQHVLLALRCMHVVVSPGLKS